MPNLQVGLTEIGVYIPENTESNYAKKEALKVDDDFIKTKIGVETVTRKAADEETSDMCIRAFADLRCRYALEAESVDCLVVVTQNPDGSGLPHTSAIVHGKLGCRDSCAAFDISLGCSGFVYALSIVTSFMQQNGMRQGLLFTADPYSKVLDPDDRNTALLFGDAATVTLLSDHSIWYPRTFLFSTPRPRQPSTDLQRWRS